MVGAELNSNVSPATQPLLQHLTVALHDGPLSVSQKLPLEPPPPFTLPGLGEKHLSFVSLNLAQADEEVPSPERVPSQVPLEKCLDMKCPLRACSSVYSQLFPGRKLSGRSGSEQMNGLLATGIYTRGAGHTFRVYQVRTLLCQ